MASSRTGQPLFIAITADVDPDANRAERGRTETVSAGSAGGVSLRACFEGLAILADALEAHALPATFFWEARTAEALAERRSDLFLRLRRAPSLEHGCHGHRHEDFAGKVSGIPLGRVETKEIVARAGEVHGRLFGAPPLGFRAPYCRLTEALAIALQQFGYVYEASVTERPGPQCRLRPYRLKEAPALWELPLCRSTDSAGRPISAYLWQLFEGRRSVSDYVGLIASLRQDCAGGLLQFALHPWHLVVSANGSPLRFSGHTAAQDLLSRFLDEASRLEGVEFASCAAYLRKALTEASP